MTDEELNALAEEIANRSPWGPNTDNWVRIYQAARAGAILAITRLQIFKGNSDDTTD